MAVAPDGALAGYGYVLNRQHVRLDVEVYVHPAHFGRGIGTTWFVSPRRGRGSTPLARRGHASSSTTGSTRLRGPLAAGARGDTPVRYFFRKEITFSEEPPAASWPTGITADGCR